ncbi:hypothetical protein QCA50_008574 [Cerrena zonata]|uniref:Uncharacterized protein n=1 Tax=Cerrena zonata TaxID=2478898 RepID=A0AAW0GA15_9APHY
MQGRRRERIGLAVASLMLIVTMMLTLLAAESDGVRDTWRGHERSSSQYTYFANDYPRTWEIGALETIHMSYEDSQHYSIETPLGGAEWNMTLPTGGTIVYLGSQHRPFTVSMFHQLRCLNIIRTAILENHNDSSSHHTKQTQSLVNHCMNYLRQMVLCRTDTTLESVRTTVGRGITVWDITHTCRDWTTVYEAAERNSREHR